MLRLAIRGRVFAAMAACLVFAGSATGEKVEQLSPKGYVNDFAGVLSPQEIASLTKQCKALDHRAGTQIAIVTIKDLEGADVTDFATRLEEKWRVGSKKTDKGILLLIAVKDHKYSIAVGYGLEGILPDAKVGDIGREMVPYLRQNDYDEAIATATETIVDTVDQDAGIPLTSPDSPAASPAAKQPAERSGDKYIALGVLVFILGVFFVVGGPLSWLRHRKDRRGGTPSRGGNRSSSSDEGSSSGDDHESSEDHESSSSSSDDSFDGFGGGESGGGGASGSW